VKTCINATATMPYTFEQDVENDGAAGFEGVEIWQMTSQTL
jgi:hypothetical protein